MDPYIQLCFSGLARSPIPRVLRHIDDTPAGGRHVRQQPTTEPRTQLQRVGGLDLAIGAAYHVLQDLVDLHVATLYVRTELACTIDPST